MYREIVFRLTAENHPDLQSRLTGFVNQIKQAQSQIAPVSLGVTSSSGSGFGGAGGRPGSGGGIGTSSGVVPGMNQSTQERMATERRLATEVVAADGTLADLRARVEENRQRAEMAKLEKFLADKAELHRRYTESIASVESELTAKGLDINDPAVQAAINPMLLKAKEKFNDEMLALDEKADAERAKLEARATARRLKGMEADVKAAETADKKHQTLMAQLQSTEKQALSSFASIGESAMKVARGMTTIGLAGEEDLKKVVQGLLKVQGAFDIISGSIQTWQRIQAVIESVRKTILLTAAAEEALATAAAARAAVQGAGGVGGAVAGGAAGSVAKNAMAGAAGASGASLLGRGLAMGAGRAAAIGGGGAVFGALGISLGLALDRFSGDGYSQGGFGERVGAGFVGARALGRGDRALGRQGGTGAGLGGWTSGSTFVDLVNSDDALERQEGRAGQLRAMIASQNQAVARGLPDAVHGFAQRRDASRNNLDNDLSNISSDLRGTDATKAAEMSKRISEEILETEKRIAEIKELSGNTNERHEAAIKAFNQEQLELERSKTALVVQRAEVSQQAAAAELASSERQLRNVEATLENQQAALMTMKEQLLSAQERFGLLDDEKQAELVDQFQRAKAGEQLDPEELRNLNSLGSAEAQKLVRDQALARAQGAGVDALFGDERGKINKLEDDIARNVNVAADIRWEVAFDKKVLEEQTAALRAAIAEGLKEQSDQAAESVAAAMRGEIGGISVRVENLEQRVAAGAGGRN